MKNMRLKTFIYLLLKNYLTVGELETLMLDSMDIVPQNQLKLANRIILQYTDEIMERLLDDKIN